MTQFRHSSVQKEEESQDMHAKFQSWYSQRGEIGNEDKCHFISSIYKDVHRIERCDLMIMVELIYNWLGQRDYGIVQFKEMKENHVGHSDSGHTRVEGAPFPPKGPIMLYSRTV